MVAQIDGIELLLGAVAERVDEHVFFRADALGRLAHDVHIPRRDEVLPESRVYMSW